MTDLQALARAIAQLDADPNRPPSAMAFWREIGKRLNLSANVVKSRAAKWGLRSSRGFASGQKRGPDCAWAPKGEINR